MARNKYLRPVFGILEGRTTPEGKPVRQRVLIDVYDFLRAFNVTDPARQHAIKKLAATGQRGKASEAQDLEESRQSVVRAQDLLSLYGSELTPPVIPTSNPMGDGHIHDAVKYRLGVPEGEVLAAVRKALRDGAGPVPNGWDILTPAEKKARFGIAYGAGPATLSRVLKVSTKDARAMARKISDALTGAPAQVQRP